MSKPRILLASCALLFLLTTLAGDLKAFDNCFASRFNVPGFGCSGNLYGLGFVPTPPYFAIHPPVYYGQRYYRSYGESPFARPARAARPLNIAVELVNNPYVELPPVFPKLPTSQPEAAKDQVASQPKMIINPYYESAEAMVQK